ncbi:MAG: endonuclease/exonuclease/phosphatase family protein [Candidatus Nanosalina sp.]
MKILSCNTGYFLGFEKPLPNYLLDPKRSCLGNSKKEEESMDALAELINREDPDIVALQEVDQGSIRTRTGGQASALEEKLEKSYSVEIREKYGPEKLLSHLPVMNKMSNAILSSGGEIREHFLEPGSKQLLLEYRSEEKDLSIFSTHMPTLYRYRKKQLRKVKEKLLERERAVLCGDFNCYRGKKELEEIFSETGYRVRSPGPTHPRSDPYRELNLFIVPEEMDIRVRKIQADISDHLPVLAEIPGI